FDPSAGVGYFYISFPDRHDWGGGWCWDDDMTPLRPLLVEKKDCFVSELPDDFCRVGIRGVTAERILQSECPADARLFCEVTHTIDEALQRMMKRSDNYYAESMFYQLATLSNRKPATRKESVAQINRLICAIGLNPDDYQIADGSGVSLYTYVSPELLVGMLRHAWQDERIRQSFYPSLPVAGVDGTLEKRMRRTAARGNVHAKTGTVTGISSLTGYASSPEGHVLAFCIINQGIPKGSLGRDWQDKVCEVFCK
ncbi:MAG: D-alanyl-D-alanine carboxypeptidase/D-alanyl-D-alanine-endopeptidase, partial [Bacteroidaceae bacterium]|nr:D-alanyl-D-alanine carboxypeptidase/D-alanyl-D-alanine-endopeptidase [Bacteroidaceae bacterium]